MNLLAADIPAPVAAQVTGTTTADHRTWAHRDLLLDDEWNKPPESGMPRNFSRLGVYQLAVLAFAAGAGIPLGVASAAFKARVVRIGERLLIAVRRGPPVTAFWEIDAVNAALAAEAVPEFVQVDTDRPVFWLVSPHEAPVVIDGQKALADAFGNPGRAMVIPITHLVAKVNAALAEDRTQE
jgi:hypothetical protein